MVCNETSMLRFKTVVIWFLENFFEKLPEQFLKELTGGLTSVTDGRILVKCQGEEKKIFMDKRFRGDVCEPKNRTSWFINYSGITAFLLMYTYLEILGFPRSQQPLPCSLHSFIFSCFSSNIRCDDPCSIVFSLTYTKSDLTWESEKS